MNSSARNAAGNLLAAALSIAVTLAVLEGVSRLIAPAYLPAHPRGFYQNDPELGYRYAPGFNGRLNYWGRHPIRIRTNSLGLRDREYGPKSPEVGRVLMLGDSQTFGMVNEAESLPRALERALNAEAGGGEAPPAAGTGGTERSIRRYEVVNAGVMGYGTDQELVLLRRLAPVYKPDVVVLTFFANDVEDNALGALSHYRVEPDGYLHDLSKGKENEGPVGFRRWAMTHINLVKLTSLAVPEIRARLRALVHRERYAPAPFKPQGYVRKLLAREWDDESVHAWARTDSLIAGLLRFARDSGAAALFVDGGSREGVGWPMWPSQSDTTEYDLDRVAPFFDAIATRSGAVCVHVMPEFRRDLNPAAFFLPGDEHWSPRGNARVAQLLAPLVRSAAEAPPGPR